MRLIVNIIIIFPTLLREMMGMVIISNIVVIDVVAVLLAERGFVIIIKRASL